VDIFSSRKQLHPTFVTKYHVILKIYMQFSIALDHFKRFFSCRPFNKDFCATIFLKKPYFFRIRFKLLTGKGWLYFQLINSSSIVFFELRISNRFNLCVFFNLRSLLKLFFSVLCGLNLSRICCKACLEILS